MSVIMTAQYSAIDTASSQKWFATEAEARDYAARKTSADASRDPFYVVKTIAVAAAPIPDVVFTDIA